MIVVLLIILLFVSVFTDTEWLGCLSLFGLIVYSIYKVAAAIKKWIKKGKTDNQSSAPVKVKVTGNPDYFCTIAGVQYHNDTQDIGGFLGYVRPEPTNQYDKNAIAVYRKDKRLIGYIPKNEQKDFREWSDKNFLPCVGFIKAGGDVPLYGKVKVIDSDPDEAEFEVIRFIKWLVSNFGVNFIPKGFDVNIDKELKTKKDWLEFLDSEIEKRENELYKEI